MASKTILWRIALTFSLLVIATFIPKPASADVLRSDSTLPDLTTFVQSIENGDKETVLGVYAEELFALPVVQQPGQRSYYISTKPDTVTEFGPASAYGNIGLLAHDFLAGQYFPRLFPGQSIQIIYGDGRIENFVVTQIDRYQATDPYSVYSRFIDLSTQENLSSTQLFKKVYMGARHLTFQTCITANGNSSWGRLFVIAEPQP